jgi:hypothetical protein
VYSCFSFESLNGKLLKLVHGANKPVVQIANAVTYMLRIPELGERLIPDSKAACLYSHLRNRGIKYTSAIAIESNIYMLGKLKRNSNPQYLTAVHSSGIVASLIFSFLRARIHGMHVCSLQYFASKSRISSVVVLDDGSYAWVEIFLKCCSCACADRCMCESRPNYVALVKKLDVAMSTDVGLCCDDLTNISLPQLRLVCKKADKLTVIPICAIKEVCIYVCINLAEENVSDLEFIFVPPNCIESD